MKEGARAREYEDALQWLVDARLVHKVYRSSAPGLPAYAYDDLSAFKIYLADVGLLRRLAMLAPTAFGEGNRLFTEFSTTSKSLKKFKELFSDKVKLRIRFSLDNLRLDGDVLNVPLFMADHADRLIGAALERRGS